MQYLGRIFGNWVNFYTGFKNNIATFDDMNPIWMCSNALEKVQNERNCRKIKCTYIVCNSCKKENINRNRRTKLDESACNHK